MGSINVGRFRNSSGVRLFIGITGGGVVPSGATLIAGIGSARIVPGVAGVMVVKFDGITCNGICNSGPGAPSEIICPPTLS